MKIKMTLLVVITAVATLSFTYVATQNEKPVAKNAQSTQTDVIGGLASEAN